MLKTAYKKGYETAIKNVLTNVKHAELTSEILGNLVPYNTVLSPFALAAGMIAGPDKVEERPAVNAANWSNVLVPGLGSYRLGKRMMRE